MRTPVTSSNIVSIGYDVDTRTLEVEFNSGAVYQYSNVPEDVYNELISASSIGAYFASGIKYVYYGKRI